MRVEFIAGHGPDPVKMVITTENAEQRTLCELLAGAMRRGGGHVEMEAEGAKLVITSDIQSRQWWESRTMAGVMGQDLAECALCDGKSQRVEPLCQSCQHNKHVIDGLKREMVELRRDFKIKDAERAGVVESLKSDRGVMDRQRAMMSQAHAALTAAGIFPTADLEPSAPNTERELVVRVEEAIRQRDLHAEELQRTVRELADVKAKKAKRR